MEWQNGVIPGTGDKNVGVDFSKSIHAPESEQMGLKERFLEGG